MPVDVLLKLQQKVNNCPICIAEIWDLRGGGRRGKLREKKKMSIPRRVAVLVVTRTTLKKKMTLRVGIPCEGEYNSQIYDPE